MSFPCLLIIPLCLAASALVAEDHDHHGHNHDHDHHDHYAQSSVETFRAVDQSGINIEMIEDRTIQGREVIAVPIAAVYSENDKTYVLAQSETDKNEFSKFEVQLGTSDGYFVEAKSGVFPGDHVAVRKTDSIAHNRQKNSPRHQYTESDHNDHIVPQCSQCSPAQQQQATPHRQESYAQPSNPYSYYGYSYPRTPAPTRAEIEAAIIYLRAMEAQRAARDYCPQESTYSTCPNSYRHQAPVNDCIYGGNCRY